MKKLTSILLALLLVLTAISCEDEASDESNISDSTADQSKVESVLVDLQTSINNNDFNTFQGLWSSSSNSGSGDLTQTVFDGLVSTHSGMSLTGFSYSGTVGSPTAKAENSTNGFTHTFKLKKENGTYYLTKWSDDFGTVLDNIKFQ
jgi:ABC-type oligopeptide transport system substrate-binding subunit